MHIGRFYPTTISLADGRPMTMYGADNFNDGTVARGVAGDVHAAAGGGAWSAPKTVPFADYYYYPWAFLLPLGDVFIAGPQKPARRFDPAASRSSTTRRDSTRRSIRRAGSTWRAPPCCSRSGRPATAARPDLPAAPATRA